jgi:hypothetical protein
VGEEVGVSTSILEPPTMILDAVNDINYFLIYYLNGTTQCKAPSSSSRWGIYFNN